MTSSVSRSLPARRKMTVLLRDTLRLPYFPPAMNSNVMDLYKMLGMRHSKVYYGFDGATAFVSALLNVDYMFGESDKYENGLYEIVNNSGDVYLYHCKYTLPLAMWHRWVGCLRTRSAPV